MTKSINMREALEELGLSKNEAEVYILLLKHSPTTASGIAKKSTISRPHIYDSINKLIEKGLASYIIKNNVKYFAASPPKKFKDFLEEKTKKFEEIYAQLEQLSLGRSNKIKIEIFEGSEGLSTVLNDIISQKEKILALNISSALETKFPLLFSKFNHARNIKKIAADIICSQGSTTEKNLLDRTKLLPKQSFAPNPLIIYGNKTASILETDPINIVVSNDQRYTASQRHYFELLWNQKTRSYYGEEGYKAAFEELLGEGKDWIGFVGDGGKREQWKQLYTATYDQYHALRRKKKLFCRVLIATTDKKIEKRLYKDTYSDYRIAPKDFSIVGAIWVFGNKISIWSTVKEPIISIIESKELAKAYRKQFDLIWSISKK